MNAHQTCDNHFLMYVSQLLMLYTLIVYSTCMLEHFRYVHLFVTLQTAAFQAPLSVGFFKQAYPVLLQGIFPIQGSNLSLTSPALIGGFFTTSTTQEAQV